jgi:hypothetical protein
MLISIDKNFDIQEKPEEAEKNAYISISLSLRIPVMPEGTGGE